MSANLRGIEKQAASAGRGLQFAGAGLTAVGAAGAYGAGLFQIPGQLMRVDHGLRELQVVGNMTEKSLGGVANEVRRIALVTNQTQEEVLSGLNDLVAKTGDIPWSLQLIEAVGKVSTAETAHITDISTLAFTTLNSLKIPTNQLMKSFAVMTQAGKLGSFELRDMATEFPEIAASARTLGVEGVKGLAGLASMMQIAKLAAPNPEEATTSVRSFMMHLTSPETRKNFLDAGIDIRKVVLQGMNDPNQDVILNIIDIIEKASKGDPFKMSYLINEVRAQKFLKAMIQNRDRYLKIRDESEQAQTGVIENDFKTMMEAFSEQFKLFRIHMTDEGFTPLLGPLKLATGFLKIMNGNALLLKGTFYGLGGMLIAGGALIAVGTLVRNFQTIAGLIDFIRMKELATLGIRVTALAVERGIMAARIASSLSVLGPTALGLYYGYAFQKETAPILKARNERESARRVREGGRPVMSGGPDGGPGRGLNGLHVFGAESGEIWKRMFGDGVDVRVHLNGAPAGTRMDTTAAPGIKLTTQMGLVLMPGS